jgi:hypothetical protein
MKMNKILTCFAIVVALRTMFFFQSCKDVCSCKKVPCPGYSNANFDQWFPYDSAQQIIYTDSAGKSYDTATVLYAYADAPYEASKGCYNGASGCASGRYINSNIFRINYFNSEDWAGVVIDSGYTIDVYDFSVRAGQLGNSGFGYADQSSDFFANINLNGKTCQNVQALWRTDTASIKGSVYKIYIQKSTGLLAYEYYPSKTIFLKK